MRQFDELAALELGITLRFEGEGEGENEVGIVAAIEPFEPSLLQTPGQSAFEHASGAQAKVKVGDVVVKVDPRYFRPTEVETLLGDPSKAKAKLGWEPTTTLPELVAEMVTADFHSARRDNLVKQAGYQAYDHHE